MRPLAACSIVFVLCLSHLAAGAAKPTPPRIASLKKLYLETDVVRDGAPSATIIVPVSGVYDDLAKRIAQATREAAGAELPIAPETAPAAALPLRGNVVALGNRSTNPFISELYNRFHTLLDLRYPGPGGHVVRTLHNPFGNGFNVVFAGGSDRAGVERATAILIRELGKAARVRNLRLGRLADIRLGKGIEVPTDTREAKIWDASAGYKSVGYFGWNSLSKHMALHYMTGEPRHAREFLRLAFPDARARQEICDIDGERVEDKDHPLSGPYHYNAHLMILFWDLIEESPAFTDDERLRVTNAFAQQLDHWTGEWAYAGRSAARPRAVGSRHGQWAAISLTCLGRYFQTHYPHPVWQGCVEAGVRHFSPLHEHAWVGGEGDNLFWYNTGIAPIFSYLMLTGDRKPLENGVLATLLRGQEALISGRQPDWALRSASIGFLHKAACLTHDGRWLTYRDRTGVDTRVFRLGQSFWPEPTLKPTPPDDLAGSWTIHRLPKPKWEARRSGLPLDESFEFASWRTRSDAGGDFVLIDGFNGASRNPYHTFAILELRLAGHTLLKGYLNQVVTRVDGLMEPKIPMDASLRRCGVVGGMAWAVAGVPEAAYATWRRTLVQRAGRYALIVDELTFREESANAEVSIEWEAERGGRRAEDGRLVLPTRAEHPAAGTRGCGAICSADPMRTTGGGRRWTMQWLGRVAKGERRTFFSLAAVRPGDAEPTVQCLRDGNASALLALPEPARAFARANGRDVAAQLAVCSGDHLFAIAATRLEPMLRADKPVDADWDFKSGTLRLLAPTATTVSLALEPKAKPTLDGKPFIGAERGMASFQFPAGRHVVRGALPRAAELARLRDDLGRRLEAATARPRTVPPHRQPLAPIRKPVAQARFAAGVVDIASLPSEAGPLLAVAEGKSIHLLALDGRERKTMATDGPIRMLRWWPEPRLLLAGCADEKVVAFDTAGARQWAFVSEMDPAVLRAAKTYWFKSAPGHEGIHGLHTGAFIGGETQAFVGSACTLEILDQRGKLVRRMPQFWGKVSTFALVDGPQGTRNLLAARKYNGVNTVAIINSKSLAPKPRGFIAVPRGHTYIGGWSSMNRHHLFYGDLDGDGTKEVVSEINGTWNRVVVWTAGGEPKHAANFGPGPRIPARTLRDLAVCDLDGDGSKEILAATSHGMVVALDAQCRKLWAVRLPSAANVLACARPKGGKRARIVLGCDDARVRFLDHTGKLIGYAQLTGRPATIQKLADPDGGELVAIGTDKGHVATYRPQ